MVIYMVIIRVEVSSCVPFNIYPHIIIRQTDGNIFLRDKKWLKTLLNALENVLRLWYNNFISKLIVSIFDRQK